MEGRRTEGRMIEILRIKGRRIKRGRIVNLSTFVGYMRNRVHQAIYICTLAQLDTPWVPPGAAKY